MMFLRGLSTFSKFFISAAIVIIILTICLTFALKFVIENSFLTHTKESTGVYIVQRAETLKPEDFLADNLEHAKEVFGKFYADIKDPEIIRIKVWDTKAKIIYSDNETMIGKTFTNDQEYQQSLKGEIVSKSESEQKATELYEETFEGAVELYVPITFAGQKSPSGVIEVYINYQQIINTLNQIGIVQIISSLTFILAAFLLFYFLFKKFVNAPIYELISTAKSFESGDLSKRAQIKSYDEIGKLGIAFNTMATRLQEYYQHLEEKVKQRTEELQKAENYYHLLFDNAPIGIGLADFAGNVISSNAAIQKIIGYSGEELKNINLADTYENPEERKMIIKILQNTDRVVGQQIRLKRKDGKVVDALLSVTKFYSDGKELLQSTIEDITAQKTAESELAKHTVELEKTKTAVLNLLEDLKKAKSEIEIAKIKDDAILENIGEGLIVTDLDRKITLVNSSAASMLNYEKEKLIGRDIEEILVIEDSNGNLVPNEKRPCRKILTLRKTSACEISSDNYLIKTDRSRFPVYVIAAPIITNHKITGVVELFRDITREKEIEREKSEFISIAAHQLRTPLGSMRWSIEMLLNEDFGKLPKDIKDMLSTVYDSNQEMISLVNDLLDVSRIEQGRITNNPNLTNIGEAIKSIIDQLMPEANLKGITINYLESKEKIPEIFIDPLHLRQVITNLISNAIKYNIYQGKVDINIKKTDRSIVISITNTGTSIPEEEQHRLFTKFFRGRNAVKNETSGTGLGLFVVKFYVGSWGGKVRMESPVFKDGTGTTFSIELPLKPKS